MSGFDTLAIICISISLVLSMAQIGIYQLNPVPNDYVKCDSTILSLGSNACHNVSTNSAFNDSIPTANIQSTGGNGFTDIFNAISTWFKTGFGSKIIGSIFAMYTMLYMTGLPRDIVALVGTAWYLITVLASIEWWRGIG